MNELIIIITITDTITVVNKVVESLNDKYSHGH